MAEQTLSGVSAALATGADLILRRDVRQLGELIADDDTAVASGSVAAHPTVALALLEASGIVEAAAGAGERYSAEDLANLAAITSGSPGYAGKELLVGLVCDIAFWVLKKRRNPGLSQKDVAGVPEAYEMLDHLRDGKRIFPFQETKDAAHIKVVPLGYRDDSENRTVFKARRLFGNRGND